MRTMIAIPVFNAGDNLRISLQSCVEQSVAAKVLVVDNCSTDGSLETAREFAQRYDNIDLVINERNLGRVGNWNRCLDLFEASECEIIKLLMAGDELLPDCVAEFEAAFDRDPELAAAFWPFIFQEASGTQTKNAFLPKGGRLDFSDLIYGHFFPNCMPGGLLCYAYARKTVQGLRFNDAFLGGHVFQNAAVLRGPVEYIETPLAIFHVKARGHFHLQYRVEYVAEYLHSFALGLDMARTRLEDESMNELRRALAIGSFKLMIPFVSDFTFFRALGTFIATWARKKIHKARRGINIIKLTLSGQRVPKHQRTPDWFTATIRNPKRHKPKS